MSLDHPLLIDNIARLRQSLLALEDQEGRRAELWRLIKNSARSAPFNFPWFTPFVALITRQPEDMENARQVLRSYVSKLDAQSFGIGMQFHFWCFAFPHAKWSLYFQWLCQLGAFEPAEEQTIRQELIRYHFINFYYGLRTKPEPECVDNQTLSLAFSNALVGYIFTQGAQPSLMAQRMLRDGMRRLPVVIGDMPPSGYSGEGSSYMDCVNGPVIPFAVELLEQVTGQRGLLTRPLSAAGGTPLAVLRMVAREWMPGGLLLPWDNYGYQLGVRAALAYAARQTRQPLFYDILEQDAIWSYDIGTGWAYDDLVWTLIWWPDEAPQAAPSQPDSPGRSWFEAEVGGALVSSDQNHYLAQMWDASAPGIPTRMHANPNAVLFNGYHVPLSADGAASPGGCPRFAFPDTNRSVSFLTMGSEDTYNYGDGCGGAHSVVLVDDWEGLRMFGDGPQFRQPFSSAGLLSLGCDAAPFYVERFPDVQAVRRRSTLCLERFFVVEDWVRFANEHKLTSRFLLRPDFRPASHGVKIETPEGVGLHLLEVLGGDEVHTERVERFPHKPDARCVLVDFSRQASEVRRLFVAFISRVHRPVTQVVDFAAVPDDGGRLDYSAAVTALVQAGLHLSLSLPPHMEQRLPISRRWWFHKRLAKQHGPAWLMLPLGLMDPQLYLNGEPLDLSAYRSSLDLIAPRVALPARYEQDEAVEIVLRTDVPVSHYEGGGDGTIGLAGGVHLCVPVEEETIRSVHYQDGVLEVRTSQFTYAVPYALMEDYGE